MWSTTKKKKKKKRKKEKEKLNQTVNAFQPRTSNAYWYFFDRQTDRLTDREKKGKERNRKREINKKEIKFTEWNYFQNSKYPSN